MTPTIFSAHVYRGKNESLQRYSPECKASKPWDFIYVMNQSTEIGSVIKEERTKDRLASGQLLS